MSRLITFGCSFTYGSALPDDWPGSPPPHNKPSQYSWSKLLADKLGREIVNNGIPGAGNLEILQKILNTKFEKDDLVVTGWSHFDRFDFYTFTDWTTGEKNDPQKYRDVLLNQFYDDKAWIINNNVKNWLSIHHASCYLKSIGIQQYNFNAITYNLHPIPKIHIENFLTILGSDWIVDRCPDFTDVLPGHPGVESQKLLANILYDKIKT